MKAYQINITLDQALQRCNPTLKEKILHGVELLRKAETIALKYSSEKGFVLGFSGGKDSQAVYHLTKLAGVKFHPFFSPTTVDPPALIRFIRQQYPDVEFLKPKISIFEKTCQLGMLPTMNIRWCCKEFKEDKYPNHVKVVGVRKQESNRRAKRKEVEVSSRKFSGDLSEFDQWSKAKIDKIKKQYKNLNQDQFSEVQDETQIRCIGGKDSIIIMPILSWTQDEVWDFLNNVIQAPHCEIYDKERHRIGCIMCPFSSLKQIKRDIKDYPHVYKKWLDVIRALIDGRRSLYSTDVDKERINKGIWEQSTLQKFTNIVKNHEVCIPSPTGQGYIETPEELIMHWWISKLPYDVWYGKNFLQTKLEFNKIKQVKERWK